MRILSITEKEKDIINGGNLLLLKRKIDEAEAIWHERLIRATDDHRYVQGVYTVLSDMKDLLT